MTSDVAAIVLAAGRGTRFGATPKLLATLDGKPLVRHAAEAALASGVAPVLVVVGHHAEDIGAALIDLPVRIVPNPAYAEGLSTSLKAGFAALPAEAEAALILLADMPQVRASLLRNLVVAWREAGRPAALVPRIGGLRGNPVVLSRALAPEVAGLDGDAGAGPLLRGRTDVVEHDVDDPAIGWDVDTPDALERLRAVQASTTPWRMAE